MTDRSKSSAASSCSSPASSASSQAPSSVSLLSASRYARRCSSVRWSSTITGASVSPSCAAARMRPCPAITSPSPDDQHRHRPAELRHRARDLRDLVRPVRLRVPRIGLQALERPRLDALRSEAQGHVRSSCREAGGTPGGGLQRWIPLGRGGLLQGPGGSHPRRGQVFVLLGDIRRALDSGCRVASQKFAAVASELPR